MKFSEVTACAIALAALRQDDRPAAGATDPPADPPSEGDALRRFLLAQPPVTVYLLAAVAYLGAGECGPGHLVDLLLRLGRHFPNRSAVVDVLVGRPLAGCLGDGLRKLTAARVNLDRLHAA